MSLKPASESLDFDIPVTPEDLAALRRNRPEQPGVNLLATFARFASQPFFASAPLRTTTSEGWPDFEL